MYYRAPDKNALIKVEITELITVEVVVEVAADEEDEDRPEIKLEIKVLKDEVVAPEEITELKPLLEPEVKAFNKVDNNDEPVELEEVREEIKEVIPDNEPEPKLLMIVDKAVDSRLERFKLPKPVVEPLAKLWIKVSKVLASVAKPEEPKPLSKELMIVWTDEDKVLVLEVKPAAPKPEKIELAKDSISLALTSPDDKLTTEERTLLPIEERIVERVVESPRFKVPTPAEAPEIKTGMIELISLLLDRLAASKAALAPAMMEAICDDVRLTEDPLAALIDILLTEALTKPDCKLESIFWDAVDSSTVWALVVLPVEEAFKEPPQPASKLTVNTDADNV